MPGTPFSERDQTMQPTQWKSWGMSGGLKSGQLMEDHVQQPRNPKTEGRNPNSENGLIRLAAAPPGWLSIRTSAFGFLSAFGLRVSGLAWPGPTLEQPWGEGERGLRRCHSAKGSEPDTLQTRFQFLAALDGEASAAFGVLDAGDSPVGSHFVAVRRFGSCSRCAQTPSRNDS